MEQLDEHGVSVPRMCLPRSPVLGSRNERRQRETHDPTARRGPTEHRLPTSLCQGRRAVGMRVERDENRSSREKVYECCLSTTTPRAVDDDVATDPERRACQNRIRTDRIRYMGTGNMTCAFNEMQLVFKNIRLTRDDLGSFMRDTPKNTTS